MESDSPIIIAIDGPAASGKSTVARQVASRLGFLYVNSGEMYRAFTWWVLHNCIDPGDVQGVTDLLNQTLFAREELLGTGTLTVQGRRLSEKELKNDQVNSFVSSIAAIPEVRHRLVFEQRCFAGQKSLVMEGRDIGTVVFPDTPYKFFIDAAPEIRAARRKKEGIADSVAERDLADTMRKASPLKPAEDAMTIDTSHLEIGEVVDLVVEAIEWKRATS